MCKYIKSETEIYKLIPTQLSMTNLKFGKRFLNSTHVLCQVVIYLTITRNRETKHQIKWETNRKSHSEGNRLTMIKLAENLGINYVVYQKIILMEKLNMISQDCPRFLTNNP